MSFRSIRSGEYSLYVCSKEYELGSNQPAVLCWMIVNVARESGAAVISECCGHTRDVFTATSGLISGGACLH